MRFDNQTVLITGGAGGQGASHARAFHAEGAAVIIAGVTDARAELLADELGERALAVRLDVSRPEDWSAAVETATRRFGPITVLINNAGVQNPPASIEDTSPEVWDRTIGINLTGQFLGIRAVTPSMRAAGGGVIINIGSTMGYGGTALYAPYVAGKWATRGLTRTAALELGRDGIRVNAVHPGVISTPLITESAGAGAAPIADFYSPAPFAVPRLGEPADITALLLFLASPEASFATGAEFVVDGGLLLGPALP